MLPLTLLFKRFLKIGATAYGGPAIAGQMKKVIVKDLAWLNEPEFMQGIAFCQLIPGATFVQLSTYIGYRLRGMWGAFVCAIAYVIPAFVLILILSTLYFTLGDLWFIKSLFKGLGAIVVAIVLNVFLNFGRPIVKDWKSIFIAALSFFAFLLHWNIVLVFLSAAVGALLLRLPIAKAGPAPPAPVGKGTSELRNYLFLAILGSVIAGIFLICFLLNTRLSILALTLSKVGALAFGGGFTIIPLIQYEVVDKFRWVNTKEFLDGIAMGQVTPGPILITATFLGYKLAGFWGATMATLAIFSPAFFIVMLLIPYYDRLKGIKNVRIMEQGILASFIGMLGLVLYNFGRTTFVDIPTFLFAAGAFVAILTKFELLYILLAGAILSIIIFGLIL